MESSDLKQLIRNGESSLLEFKTEGAHNDSIAKEIVAFANFSGGKLLIGVSDEGEAVGVQDRSVEQRVVQICRNNVFPSIIPVVQFSEIDGKTILVVEVPKGENKPYRVKGSGKFYIRAGSSSLEPSNEELVRLFQNGGLVHYETKPVYGSSISDLNRSYLNEYFVKYRSLGEDIENEEEIWQMLFNLYLTTKANDEYVPTVAGLILFGSNPGRFLPQSGAQAVCFRGDDEASHIVEMKEFNGAATDIVEGLLRFVERNSTTEVKFKNEVKRDDIQQYPASIVRELVANGIAHRDYSIWGAVIRLCIFDGRLEMRSPGKLPNTMTVERMKIGVSYHRNPTIMQTLRDYGYVEKIGRGILRSNRRLRDLNRRELDIKDLGAEVRVILHDR